MSAGSIGKYGTSHFSELDFDRELTFEEFKVLVDKYNNNSKYPDIDN